jgi:glycosyltransferase involved in cell wall biosynthesis
MKLLIFSPYYPPHIGGVEFYAEEMNAHLLKNGYDLTVFTPQLPIASLTKEILKNKEGSKIKIIRFPAFDLIDNYPLPKFWSLKFWKLFFNLFSEKFDIVLSHTRFFSTSLLALWYAKFKKVAWLHIEHGSDFVQSKIKFISLSANFYDYIWGRLILKMSDKNIGISQEVATFIKKFDKRQITIIRRGIMTKKIDSLPSLKLPVKTEGAIVIGFVGRLISGKGLENLIIALSQIQQRDFKCFIIGEGVQKKQLQELVKKNNLQDKIFFLGEKIRKETIGLLKNFDIFVNPSYSEGLPTTVLEAGLCQNAIIATAVGGTAEIIQSNKNGFLIKSGDVNDLKIKLLDLMTNPAKMERFGNEARNHIIKNFSWDKSIQKYEKEFKKIMAEK